MKLKQVIVKRMYLYPTILAVFMLMTSGINAFAQDKSDKIKITGTVYDETKQPLAGASVREERTSNGTITDQDGNFTIYVKKGSTIRIFLRARIESNDGKYRREVRYYAERQH